MEHKFNVELACKYGIEEAIIIDNIYYWIKKNIANAKHHYEDRYWTYNTANAFTEIFPYISQTKIYRILTKLEQENVILKRKFNRDKHIQTNWYSFTNDGLLILEQEKYDISNISDHFANLQNGICKKEKCITNSIITNKKEEIDKSIHEKDNLFEECWLEYKRKGSKKKSKEYWDKLSNDEKQCVLPHIKAYVSTRELSYQKDFERYLRDKIFATIVFSKNNVIFDPTKKQKNSEYIPQESPSLFWNDYYKCYMYVGYWDGHISDGYDDTNRPNGAKVTLNNGRGVVVWNGKTKKWENDANLFTSGTINI